jgi:hypothetical protein
VGHRLHHDQESRNANYAVGHAKLISTDEKHGLIDYQFAEPK